MHFRSIVALLWCHLSQAVPSPVDAIVVQIQQWGDVGTQHVTQQVLLNGVSFTSSDQEINSILQTMSVGALLPAGIGINQIPALNDHTILRSRECILEGPQLHWTDRLLYDGKVYLTLNHNDTWTAHEPQAVAFKVLWDQDVQRTRTEKTRLQEGCVQLIRELRLSEEQSAPGISLPHLLIPILAVVAFIGLIAVSILVSKSRGSTLPGGIIGSVIHYPKGMNNMTPDVKGGYCSL
ncbi:uncharacterized protein [Leuresthes tenuis]|uniref:uncharacterized protein n=1 Tax=Leuresthes tenuis TaxID=355514 RepID=UPI003B501480